MILAKQQLTQVTYKHLWFLIKKWKFNENFDYNSAGFQTDIGQEKVTHPVYFYVHKNSLTTIPGVIKFEIARLNIGNAMDIKTGIFTAPRSGVYFFLFSGLKAVNNNGDRLEIRLQINGSFNVALAWFSNVASFFGGGLHSTLRLNAGDTVALVLQLGVLYDNPWDYYSHFSGWLLEEDLAFKK